MILTARYLTNQLLYQRTHHEDYDNRRNGSVMGGPNCMDLLLAVLRDILRGDFSEYNAKNYQSHTRYAILNLYHFAYDHEVRLAARMVLDYIAARIAVSSSDLRRLVPFRRRNEGKNVTRDKQGFMQIGLVEMTAGADPSMQHMAMLAGNTRIYATRNWLVKTNDQDGNEFIPYALGDYRLPLPVHALFVSDAHRRFYQKTHRTPLGDPEVGGRNCDNYEIYAGSPSYLLTAGGAFATWAVDPGPVTHSSKLRRENDQQLGVALPSSFMPTPRATSDCGDQTSAESVIQFGRFSDVSGVFNYGVAPDFACGPHMFIPRWCDAAMSSDSDAATAPFKFVNRGSAGAGPGFFLAIYQDGDFAVLEAFDTWVHPEVTFNAFRSGVVAKNRGLTVRGLRNGVTDEYTTQAGNVVRFTITDRPGDYGARIDAVDATNSRHPAADSLSAVSGLAADAFLVGTVLNSIGNGIVEISNQPLGSKVILDMSDQARPRRTSEVGQVEQAGRGSEVWVKLGWQGGQEGDVFRPFATLAAARAAKASDGIIRLMP